MHLNTKPLFALSAAGLTLCLSQGADAAIVADYQFNTVGDTEGWAVLSNVTGLAADGDSLNGTAATNDPQLTSGTILLTTTEGWDTLVFRVREIQDEAPAGPVDAFNPIGVVATLGGSTFSNAAFVGVDSGDDFYTVTLDISSLGTNNITSIRLDPIGGASSNSNSQTTSNTFEIDFIQISDVPEPSSLALLGLGGLAMLRRRR